MACGGDLNSPDTVIKLTRALRMIGGSSLVLAHVAKAVQDGQDRSAYGSVFFRELARNVWEINKAEGDGSARVILSHKKNNFGPLHPPLAFDFTFEGESVQVTDCAPMNRRSRVSSRCRTGYEISWKTGYPAAHKRSHWS